MWSSAPSPGLLAGGPEALHEEPLPEEADLQFRIFLEGDQPPVEEVGRVAWQDEGEDAACRVGIRFQSVNEEIRHRMESFVASALSDDLVRRQALEE